MSTIVYRKAGYSNRKTKGTTVSAWPRKTKRKYVKKAYVKGALKSAGKEIKLKQVNSFTLPFDTTGSITLCNGIQLGDTELTRDGQYIMLKNFKIRGYFRPDSYSASLPTLCRLMLIWDNAANGVTPVMTDFLTAASSLYFPNYNNKERFTFIRDWSFAMANLPGGSPTNKLLRATVPINQKVKYNAGNAGTVADIQNGALYLVSIGNNAAGSGTNYAMDLDFKIEWVEV